MIRILLVDDHRLIRSSLRTRLDREPDLTTVGEAGTVPQAIRASRTLQPDVVLLDLVLPRRSGSDAVQDLLEEAPSMRILVVSSLAQPTSVRRALAAGAHGYVPKQASDTELIEAIHRVAAGERYVDPDLGAQLVIADAVPALEPVSDRERDVLSLLALGYTNQEIGKKLYISIRTVDTHRAHIMRKLDLATRAELVLFALAHGLIGAS
jgi:DNA-binding NarL/FixJ family response regulator